MKQFFGKSTWITFAALAAVTILGFVFKEVEVAQLIALIVLGVVGFIAYWKKPELAFGLVFAELFAFSHGRLFAYDVGGFFVSSRMVLFAAVMLAWAIKLLFKKGFPRYFPVQIRTPWAFFFIALVIGLIVGLPHNETRAVLDDLNGYLYAAYLFPVFSIPWDRSKQHFILQMFTGTVLWVSSLSLILLYMFTHLPGDFLAVVYRFVRDVRIGEITLMEGGYWRVFIQSQIVLVLGLLIYLGFDMSLPRKPWFRKRLFWLTALTVSGLVISLSRSFWLGLIVAIPYLVCMKVKLNPATRLWDKFLAEKKLGSRFFLWFSTVVVAIGLLAAVSLISFPIPSQVVDLRSAFTSRTTGLDEDAISSRWNLLPVMLQEMQKEPIFGSGFGKELAFTSDDPRVREIYPDGKWRTYKFEWGWIDLWIKMGAMGLFSYIWIFLMYNKLLQETKNQPEWLKLGLQASLVALAVIHFFSPYLNHPLGIGILLFISVFVHEDPAIFEQRKAEAEEKARKLVSSVAVPATRVIDNE